MPKHSYISHIDALRALAVIVVLLFHFEVPGFVGGFLGVDVFFVISGYLVTRLVAGEAEATGRFAWARFMARRVRRLFPALFVTALLTLVVGYVVFDSQKLAAMASSVATATLSLSNIWFWTESGYFSADSATKPLLHTWSLSVEEQFYLLWPPVIGVLSIWLARRHRLLLLGFCAGLLLLSFGSAWIWLGGGFDPRATSTVFFWMPFRIYELMLGAGLYFLLRQDPSQRTESWPLGDLVLVGIILLILAKALPIEKMGAPKMDLLLGGAVGGLAAVFIARGAGPLTIRFTEMPFVRWTGKISYSLYLVHWPVWVFTQDQSWMPQAWWLKAALMFAASYALASAMHYWVEEPFRKGKLSAWLGRASSARDLFAFLCMAIALVAASIWISRADRLPLRKYEALTADQIANGKGKRFRVIPELCRLLFWDEGYKNCHPERPIQMLVLGNSTSVDGQNALQAMFGDNPAYNIITFSSLNGCNPVLVEGRWVDDTSARDCDKRVATFDRLLEQQHFTHVVHQANRPFGGNKEIFWDIMGDIQKRSPQTHHIQMSGFYNLPEDCSTIVLRNNDIDACTTDTPDQQKPDEPGIVHGWEVDPSLYLYVDRYDLMCSGDRLSTCEPSAGGEPFMYDQNHLSREYAREMGRRMIVEYADEFRAIGLPID